VFYHWYMSIERPSAPRRAARLALHAGYTSGVGSALGESAKCWQHWASPSWFWSLCDICSHELLASCVGAWQFEGQDSRTVLSRLGSPQHEALIHSLRSIFWSGLLSGLVLLGAAWWRALGMLRPGGLPLPQWQLCTVLTWMGITVPGGVGKYWGHLQLGLTFAVSVLNIARRSRRKGWLLLSVLSASSLVPAPAVSVWHLVLNGVQAWCLKTCTSREPFVIVFWVSFSKPDLWHIPEHLVRASIRQETGWLAMLCSCISTSLHCWSGLGSSALWPAVGLGLWCCHREPGRGALRHHRKLKSRLSDLFSKELMELIQLWAKLIFSEGFVVSSGSCWAQPLAARPCQYSNEGGWQGCCVGWSPSVCSKSSSPQPWTEVSANRPERKAGVGWLPHLGWVWGTAQPGSTASSSDLFIWYTEKVLQTNKSSCPSLNSFANVFAEKSGGAVYVLPWARAPWSPCVLWCASVLSYAVSSKLMAWSPVRCFSGCSRSRLAALMPEFPARTVSHFHCALGVLLFPSLAPVFIWSLCSRSAASCLRTLPSFSFTSGWLFRPHSCGFPLVMLTCSLQSWWLKRSLGQPCLKQPAPHRVVKTHPCSCRNLWQICFWALMYLFFLHVQGQCRTSFLLCLCPVVLGAISSRTS